MLYLDRPYSNNFCRQAVATWLDIIAKHESCNLVAMSGLGITFFTLQLEHCSPHPFVSVNSYEMPEFTKTALYNQLARKLGLGQTSAEQVDLQAIGEALKAKAADTGKVVLVLNRFDRFGPILDQGFYENLRFLQDVCGGKLFTLFVTAEPLTESTAPGIQELLRFMECVEYFQCFKQQDLLEILVAGGVKEEDIEPAALELSGGHHALMLLLLRCQHLGNALSDPMPEMMVKGIYLGLSPKRRKDIDAVAAGRKKHIDPFLINAGYVVEGPSSLQTFTPLLAEYALRQHQEHLPTRELRLLRVLRRSSGRVVSKQEIFDAVWRESDGIASDWALNALVYRLRRHPGFDSQRYAIESHKKQGYLLRDHQA